MNPLRRAVPGPLTRFRTLRSSSLATRRWNSTQPSPVSSFYGTFTRPVAKCLLLALFTYQVAYWAWVKLEQDEIKAERRDEISKLEAQVRSLQEETASKNKPEKR